MTSDYKILSGMNLIESLRYGGYKNPAHAVAELIDNSIEAKAKHVELICLSEWNNDTKRFTVSQIAILDDGSGMNKEKLRRALRFGDGTRRDTGGIGKFGVGLPASSLSQCRRVDAYSWTKSASNTIHTYLDLDRVKGGQDEVPAPTRKSLPAQWKKAAKHLSKTSGTLIIWSNLDRCAWKRASTIFKHSELLIGRLYRKYLVNDVQIRMAAYEYDGGSINPDSDSESRERYVVPNDPMYLMAPSSTPGKWGQEPMFQKDGDRWEDKIPIKIDGAEHVVTVRYSIVKPGVREKDNPPGSAPHGKHAGANAGISIIRANRELDLDTNLLSGYDPTDRWWGCEVDFPPALDDFFGVTNSKQGATHFSDIAKNIKEVIGNKGERERIRELKNDGDVISAAMAELIVKIWPRIRQLNAQNDLYRKGTKTRRHQDNHPKPEDVVAQRRKEEGHKGRSDETETEPEQERAQDIKKVLIDAGNPEKEAEDKARIIIQEHDKFVWTTTMLSGTQFFDVTPKSGVIHIKLNIDHAAYKNLVEVLDEVPENITLADANMRLRRAHKGLRLLLASWGRFEDETLDDKKRRQIADLRYSWGSVLESFLEPNVE